MNLPPDDGRRTVRSFVRRAGRITPAQQRSLDGQWARYGLEPGDAPVDLQALFGRVAPCTLEIGFGNGDNLAQRAAAEPARDFIGAEVHLPGIGSLLRSAAAAGLANLRVFEGDAVRLLQVNIAPGTLDEVQILFPDPWPKKRHHKRRLVQPEFARLAASRLAAGGRLLLATDWAPYAEQMRMVLDDCPLLRPCAASDATHNAALALPGRQPTRFERRGTRLGHAVADFCYLRRAD
jgi:tRNA (guanine-N7-)-methyltransferase